jgi:hypothetical protein
MDVVIGSDRLWCPETVNGVVGVSHELAIAFGHSTTFVWRLPDGALVARWPRLAALAGATGLTRAGDEVIVAHGARRVAVDLATGAARPISDGLAAAPRREVRGRPVSPTTEVVDVATGAVVWARSGVHAALSADGAWVIAGELTRSRLAVVHLDAPGGPRALFDDEPVVASSEIARAGDVVVAGDRGGAGVWSVATGARRTTLVGAGFALAARGDRVVAACGAGVARWTTTGPREAYVALPGQVQCGGFDRAGRWFAGALYRLPGGLMYDALPGLWWADLDAGVAFEAPMPVDYLRTCAIAPDGARAAVCDADGLRLIERAPGWPVRVLGPGDGQASLWFSPDGASLWVGAGDEQRGGVVSLADGGRRPLPLPHAIWQWAEAGVVVVDGDEVRLHDPGDGAPRAQWRFGAAVSAASVDARGVVAATHDGRLHVRAPAW